VLCACLAFLSGEAEAESQSLRLLASFAPCRNPRASSFPFQQPPPPPGMETTYKFGPYKIDAREVFHATPLSYAMVNLRPLLPGNTPHSLFTSPLPMLLLG